MSSVRSPDAAQRGALAPWCAADPGSISTKNGSRVCGAAYRTMLRIAGITLHRARDANAYRPSHFGGRFSENAFGPSI
jgi:hypothetical protein